MNTPRIFRAVVVSLWLIASGLTVSAAEVRADLSRRETYVGLPVTLQVRIVNAQDFEPPEIPDVDGLKIESAGSPSRSSSVSIVNGRRSSSNSVIYAFQVTPQHEGTFKIPPLAVKVDGRIVDTQPLSLVATKSETGDLMFVEVEGKQPRIYVGQALDLKLKIWLRPFRDDEREVVLSEADMWMLISEQTNWGPFADRMSELASENKRPAGEEVLRHDSEGRQRSYYLYEIDATIYPQRPGQIDAQELRVIANYPTAVGRSRDPFAEFFGDDRFPLPSRLFHDDFFSSRFGSRLRVQSVRPIVATATVDPIIVRPVPAAGRPDDYRGAVGQYQIVAEAKPTEVAVGDPITLNLGIVGDGPMELVQAPPLHEIAELAGDFKVPREPLAGIVDGPQKVFSTTIRPRHTGIESIPAIPLSYFDPTAEKFVPVYSNPISIKVNPGESLALDAIVAGNRPPQSGPAAQADSGEQGPALQNFAGPELLDHRPLAAGPLTGAQQLVIMVPPLAALIVGVWVRRRTLRAVFERLRSPRRALEAKLARTENPGEIVKTLTAYVNRRTGVGYEASRREAALGELRRAGHRDVAIETERLFHRCDELAVHHEREHLTELCQQAIAIAEKLEQSSARRLRTRQSVARRSGSAVGLLICLLPMSSLPAADPPALSRASALEILSEAHRAYEAACDMAESESDESRRLFAESAEKYQLVIDSGVQNPLLYFNLGNAYLQSGRVGHAIAGYHRALRIDPTLADAHNNLAYANSLLDEPPRAATFVDSENRLGQAVDYLIRLVQPRVVLISALVGWFAVWVFVALRLWGMRTAWKSLTLVALMLCFGAAAAYFYLANQFVPGTRAILVSDTASLRAGDGENFGEVASLSSSAGRPVTVLHQRRDWVKISVDGQTGWLHRRGLEVL